MIDACFGQIPFLKGYASQVNRIEKLLSVGDLRTTGKSEEVVKLVLSNPQLFEDVINAILTDDPGIRMRASDKI